MAPVYEECLLSFWAFGVSLSNSHPAKNVCQNVHFITHFEENKILQQQNCFCH